MSDTPTHTADVVIVGGGVTGCVIATRLSAAQPNLKILIMEMGPDVRDEPAVRTPGIYMNNLVPGAPYSQFYIGEPSEALLGNSVIVAAGACVGGGSAINWMVYTRGSASDYDDWKNEYGNPGWGFDDLLPLFKKSEAYFGEGDLSTHGTDGPLQATYGGIVSKINLEWFKTAPAYDGRPVVPDGQDFKTGNAFTRWAKWIGKDGKRSDIAHGYLYPQMDRSSNITLLTKTHVSRVLFEGDKAVGVEYFTSASDPPRQVRATKMVVVTAGTLSTPQILERSGIGARAHLEALGIPVVSDLPNVGEGYQDHLIVKSEYVRESDDTGTSRDDLLRGIPEVMERVQKEYTEHGTGELATNEADVATCKWLYKLGREQARRMPSYRGEYAAMHPSFPPGGEAACKAGPRYRVGPVAMDAPDIVYSSEDEKALEEWIRRNVGVVWHGVATCAMRPRADGGVVSPRLDVYGTQKLKVADLSICPSNVSANMYSTAVAVGEKAAQLILEDLAAV
ncbi:alcohol oxidase [Exidia glandulosa HHB12029]|uniref:Alcohol oxidase n=1 Tax=Exidia glandulosa HHB12029 TaxID=1314781 RepID=A0A165NYM7_EXIGL|nr:alcohol oxidase [Exidia glandulosa HHB12029]